MRDVLIFSVNSEDTIVVASDNSGAIGEKEKDFVKVPYETVAYYSFRVAVMECLSAGAAPFAAALQNFCGDGAWDALVRGIKRGAGELGMMDLKINGSTESNFIMQQSAVGLSVLGIKKGNGQSEGLLYTNQTEIAVIGSPLVGEEVVERGTEAAPLKLFQEINSLEDIETLPVGSKGIIEELNSLFLNKVFTNSDFNTDLDLHKSSGPSTCFIAVYPQGKTKEIRRLAGSYFHILSEV